MRHHTLLSVPAWFITLIVLACTAGFTGSARAQEVPYTGVVKQNQTDVRSGAADSFYRVGELNKGQLVQVDEVIVGWYKIVPPDGIHSYISKAFVDAKGDGSVGVVNADRTEVKAADINGPAGSYRTQAILNEGDGVQIVDEEGSHYRIVAPADAYVYLPPGSVRRALAMEIAAEEPDEAEPEVIEPEPTPEPEPVREPEPVVIPVAPVEVEPVEPQPVVVAPVVETPAEDVPLVEVPEPVEPVVVAQPVQDPSQAALDNMLADPAEPAESEEPVIQVELLSFADLEAKMESFQDTPIEDRPLDELVAQYELLKAEGGLDQQQTYRVSSRLATLRHNQQIVAGLAVIAAARQPRADADDQPAEAVNYDAVGRLLASSVYDGRTLPRMYRLADPATGRAVAYIRPGGPVDTTGHLGKLVGVQGKQDYDPALKLKVIHVTRIDALQPAE